MSVSSQAALKHSNKKHTSALRGHSAGNLTKIERLEDRRLLSATLALVNPNLLPASDRLIFNYIQNPDPTVANVVHNQQSLEVTNTGTTPLLISSMTISGPWTFVGSYTGGAYTVNPGTPLTVTLAFTQRSLPAHSTNETNFTAQPNGGAYATGSLTIISNDPTTPTKTVTLAGYWQSQSANEEEPSLATIVNGLAGYDTVLSTPAQQQSSSNGVDFQNNGATPTIYGQEVVANSWVAADSTQPVTIQELAEFYVQGATDNTYWYSATTSSNSHLLMTSSPSQGQTVLPTTAGGQLMQASFTPGGAFGLRVDNHYSNDAINTTNGDTIDDGHRFRFYPLIDENGNAVPNSWIVAVHEGSALADYQDEVYVVTNMQPAPTATTPPAPTNLTASVAADPVLSWTGVTYATLAGYNVYRSTSPTGTFTKLTSTPITTTSFTDTASPPTGVTLYYRVTAVDNTTGDESAPATASTNIPVGPEAGSFTVSAFAGQTVTIPILPHVTDVTGTPNVSTLVNSAAAHGTTTVDTTNGVIDYTATAGFSGTDTLTYSITDSNSQTATGTITISVTNAAATAPIASAQSGTTLANTAVILTPAALDNTGAAITPSLVEIANTNADFTAVPLPTTLTTATGATLTLNSNNTVTYTPAANFVGSDSFLFKVQNSQGVLSAQAVFSINVGVQIASTRFANKSVAYPDASGQLVTVTLNRGVADVYYAGTGTESVARGKVTVTGSRLTISNITASQTTAASALTLTTRRNAGTITLGGVTDTGTLGSITGVSTNLSGTNGIPTIAVGGLRSINLKSISSASIQVGGVGVASDTLTAGTVTNSSFSSAVTVNSLRVKSWANSTGNQNVEAVTAPILRTLSVTGEFDPNLTLTSGARDLYSARITGAVNKGLWSFSGSAGPITLGSVGGQWGGLTAAGKLSSLAIRAGGLAADISAGSINTLTMPGVLSGNVTTTGNLLLLQASQLVGSLVDVGSTAPSAAAATLANIGSATLLNLRLTSRAANTFSDSNVIAGTIGSVTTGPINTAGTAEGIAAAKIKAAAVTVNGEILHLNAKTLLSNAALAAFLSQKGASLGTFVIDVV